MNSRSRIRLLLTGVLLPCQWLSTGIHPAAAAVEPFDLRQVTLLDGPFKTAMDRNAEYLLELEPDRFLHYFRTEAGLPAKAPPYPGWETQGQGSGRCLGHYLSALSLEYRASGDARFKQRVDYIIDQLGQVQRANGNGYIGAELNGKQFWAALAAGDGEALKKHRVPWYIQHKLFAGLRDAYVLAGNEQAKTELIKLSDWAIMETAKLDDAAFQKMLDQEHGGMREVMADVNGITGDKKYLDLANRFIHHKVIDPLAAGVDDLPGLHANTQIPKIIGSARVYELTGDPTPRRVAEFFWDRVVHFHTYANGGDSDEEHFDRPGDLAGHLGTHTSETCNTYNMLKLTRHLFEWNPRIEYGDYMERALYNHILASLGPAPGNFTYYVAMKPGHFRFFSEPFNSFWCCVGTGMENHTKYAGFIYFHDDRGLYVNLFIPSELKWPEKGLMIRQETKYPDDGAVMLKISCAKPTPLAIHLRYPTWAQNGLMLSIDGTQVATDAKPGSYVTVDRIWNDGDRLAMTVPLQLRTESLPGSDGGFSIFYGPLLLSGQFAAVDPASQLLGDSPAGSRAKDSAVPALAVGDRPVSQWIVPVPGSPLTFQTSGVGLTDEIRLVPFFEQTSRRYTVYWNTGK